MGTWEALNALVELVKADAPRDAMLAVLPACEATRDAHRPKGPTRPCTVEDCDKPHMAKGLCRKHYSRRYRLMRAVSS